MLALYKRIAEEAGDAEAKRRAAAAAGEDPARLSLVCPSFREAVVDGQVHYHQSDVLTLLLDIHRLNLVGKTLDLPTLVARLLQKSRDGGADETKAPEAK